jgi:site-specific recombinase XerD
MKGRGEQADPCLAGVGAADAVDVALEGVGATTNRSEATQRSLELQSVFDNADLPDNTRRVYGVQWRQFAVWCAERGSLARPARPRVVVLYLAMLRREQLAPATLKAACHAIAKAHELSGDRAPTGDPIVVRWRRRLLGGVANEPHRVPSLTPSQIRQIVVSMNDDDLAGLRDRALLLLGYAARLRRADLVSLDVEDVTVVDGRIELLFRGQRIPIPAGRRPETCPVRAVQAWIHAADLRTGPLFLRMNRWGQPGDRLSDRAVGLIVQLRARGAGLAIEGISADSLHMGPPDDRNLL